MSIAIKAENLSKAYHLGEIGTGTISRDLERWFARIRGKGDPFLRIGETTPSKSSAKENMVANDMVWSLKDINFEIEKGDAVGIIGNNGAGKSTLLKILSRVTTPTTGKITGNGRIASLLEIGTGFNPELTGLENIYLNGTILGMRKQEIKKKLAEIIDFAGVDLYINTPVKRYSSGMYVRLAFAVAAHLDSEILVVDEVLAVGDAEFQKKCLGKMNDVSKGEGRTVLFVSHNLGSIATLCNQAMLLDKGILKSYGATDLIISNYVNSEEHNQVSWSKTTEKYTDSHFDLLSFHLVNKQKEKDDIGVVRNCDLGGVCFKFEIKELHPSLCFGIAVYNQQETLLFWSYHTDKSQSEWITPKLGINEMVVWLPNRTLNEGTYKLKVIAGLHHIKWIVVPQQAPFINLKIIGGLSDSPIWNDVRPGLLAPVLNFERL